jgi:flavin reductase (DIM6/NTAB) family NADH-FMN oxidoreductase RutF
VVPDDAHDLAELFGSETGDDVDKFARCAWVPGPGGAPILEACSDWFAGRIVDRFDVGDHRAILLELIRGADDTAQDALSFQEARSIEPGHEP